MRQELDIGRVLYQEVRTRTLSANIVQLPGRIHPHTRGPIRETTEIRRELGVRRELEVRTVAQAYLQKPLQIHHHPFLTGLRNGTSHAAIQQLDHHGLQNQLHGAVQLLEN